MADLPPRPWPTGIPETVGPLVVRLLAPNPSPYTYTGTQTHIVGEGRDRAVIDPGPDDPPHLDAILAALGSARLAAIVCTHTHRDHSTAAAPLAARLGAPIIGCAPLSHTDGGARADAAFDATYRADRILDDGDRVSGDGWTLRAVSTPGHTSNHICLALEETGALFTGDHVMGWSTSVIAPPDGDMTAYLASLEKLRLRNDRIYHPSHGPSIEKPAQFVRGLLGHRRQRERQILRHLEAEPLALSEFIPRMYRGLDERLHGAAQASVKAHLIDLERRNLVKQDRNLWHKT